MVMDLLVSYLILIIDTKPLLMSQQMYLPICVVVEKISENIEEDE